MYETTEATLHYIGNNHDFEDWAREVVYKVNTLITQKIHDSNIQRFNFYLQYVDERKDYELHKELQDNPNHVPTGELSTQELDKMEPYYVFRFEYQDPIIDPLKKGIGISDLAVKTYFNSYFYNQTSTKTNSVSKASYYIYNSIVTWFNRYWE